VVLTLADKNKGCIGYQLAQMELAVTAALFIREFPNAKVSSIMTERDMELEDKFVMNPKGQKCLVVLE
jgi:cytochrome P450